MAITFAEITSKNNSNPLLALLKENNTVETFNTDNRELQLLVLDESTFTATNTSVLNQARQFLGSGKPLTILNPGKEQEDLIQGFCKLSSSSDNISSWTIIPVKSAVNCPKWIFLKQHEVHTLATSSVKTLEEKGENQNKEKRSADNPDIDEIKSTNNSHSPAEIENQLLKNHYDELLKGLQGELPEQQDSGSYPPGLFAVSLHNVENYSIVISPIYDGWKNAPSQGVTLTETTEIIVFLNDPAGTSQPYQQVAFNQKVVFGCGGPGFYSANTKGWYNMNCNLSQSTSDTELIINDASPKTPNNSTTITSSTSFSVGFSGSSPSGSYSYSKSVSETITDWGVIQNNSSANQASWEFFQQNPFNCSTPITKSIFNGAVTNFGNNFKDWHAANVSDLAKSSIIMAPQTAWSNQVAKSKLSFSTSGTVSWGTTCVANPFSGSECTLLQHVKNFSNNFNFADLPTSASAYKSIDPGTFNSYIAKNYNGGLKIYANITNNTSHNLYIYKYYPGTAGLSNLKDTSGNNIVLSHSSGSNILKYADTATDLVFINDEYECVAILSISIAGSSSAPLAISLEPDSPYAPVSIFPSSQDSCYQYFATGTSFTPKTGPSIYWTQIFNCSGENAKYYIVDDAGVSQAHDISPMSVGGSQINIGNYITACKDSSNSSKHDDLGIYKITQAKSAMNVYIDPDSGKQPSGS